MTHFFQAYVVIGLALTALVLAFDISEIRTAFNDPGYASVSLAHRFAALVLATILISMAWPVVVVVSLTSGTTRK